jgi:hypothetical protein
LTLLKSLVVSLVLANVCYFLWQHGIAKAPETVAPPPALGSLKLASESPDFVRGESSGSGTATALAPSAATAASGSAAVPSDGVRDAASPNLLTNVKRCISIGPFRDVSEAAHAASTLGSSAPPSRPAPSPPPPPPTLRGGGYDPRQRVADGEVWAGVWVYLPLPTVRAVADQTLAKLKSGGIDDALEMPGPNEGSVISLGLYSESKRAQARVAQAQALGFNPGIADRKRNGNVYWIDIDLKPTDSLLNPSDLQGESGRIVRLEVKGCPSAGGQG